MNNSKQETISDIVAEMRGNAEHNHALGEVSKYLTEIADRIEAAYNREREAGVQVARRDIDTVICRYGRLVKKLRSENERLLSALKPVLDAYISQDNPSAEVYDSRLDAAICVRTVRDAKRIYKGGAK